MRGLVGILPWAVVVAIGGGAVWFLLDRQVAAGQWLLAALIAGHGLVHVLYLVPRPQAAPAGGGPTWPFDLARSWLVVRAGLGLGTTRLIAAGLIGIIVSASVLAALATVGILVPASWWPGLVVVATGASLVLLVAAFDPHLVVGIAIDGVLLWVVLAAAWRPPG